MDLSLEIILHKATWKLKLEQLSKRTVEPWQIKKEVGTNSWLYFRRANPRSLEIYREEDFVPGSSQNEVMERINSTQLFRGIFNIKPSDLLCLNIEGQWVDCVRFEGVWVESSPLEVKIWDHYLLSRGKVFRNF